MSRWRVMAPVAFFSFSGFFSFFQFIRIFFSTAQKDCIYLMYLCSVKGCAGRPRKFSPPIQADALFYKSKLSSFRRKSKRPMVSMPSSLRRGSTYRRSQNISIAYIIFLPLLATFYDAKITFFVLLCNCYMKKMPLLAFISFTSNFSAPFFHKKSCRIVRQPFNSY